MELEVVYGNSFKCYKLLSLKMKKNHQKDVSHLKNDKHSSHSKRNMKGKMKNEKHNKSLNKTKAIKLFTSIFFVYWKEYILPKYSLGKCSLHYYILIFFFSVVGYLKGSNETPASI